MQTEPSLRHGRTALPLAPLDSRINDSDVPWRNAFRTAAELMSNAIVPRFTSSEFSSLRDGETRGAFVHRYKFNLLNVLTYSQLNM